MIVKTIYENLLVKIKNRYYNSIGGIYMDSNLKRSIILEHFQNPKNRGLIEDDTYIRVTTNNESCIDEIYLMVKIDNDIIQDIRFDGEACAICTSATSIMINTLIGKTVKEAKEIYNNYVKMLNEETYNQELLEEANVYDDISKQPNRKKCALLPWWGIDEAIKLSKNEQ